MEEEFTEEEWEKLHKLAKEKGKTYPRAGPTKEHLGMSRPQ
ncbi:hypothetical protein [Candidatus Hakubella thermalkaliphila]|nr:hypothetical protein [Candidatus Hakubella thermalkaliphila]